MRVMISNWRSFLVSLNSLRRNRRQRPVRRRLWLEELEPRTVPTVTAVNELFTTSPSTPTTLNVLQPDAAASNEPVSFLTVGPVSPSGPTLTENADGSLTFTSAAGGRFTFNQTITGAQQEVTANDGAANDNLGDSVATNGTTVVIGAGGHKVGSNSDQGAVYVFTLTGSTWTLQQELTAADGAAGDEFGASVALNGTTLVVGAANHAVGSNAAQGAVYVYMFNGSTWSLQQELTAGDGAADDLFGTNVAVSGDTLVASAIHHQFTAIPGEGGVYVYTLAGSTWSLQQELFSPDGAAGDEWGRGLAIDGDTLVVGSAPHPVVGHSSGPGAAYVFTRAFGFFNSSQRLTAPDGAQGNAFGFSVAVSGDIVVVGAYNHTVGSNAGQGAVYLYGISGATAILQQEFSAANGAAGDSFGESVALDGNTLVVGAGGHKVGSNAGQGAAYVYTISGSTATLEQELTAVDGKASAFFGVSVAFSGDTAVVGANGQTVGSNAAQGAAYVQDVSTSSAVVTVNVVTAPTTVTAMSGSGQTAAVKTAFVAPLVAIVTDANGLPVPGVTVTFAGPGSGAGVTFPGGNTAVTDAQGQASIDVTANATTGRYTVTGSIPGVTTPANFVLKNIPGPLSLAQSPVTISPSSIQAGATATVTLTAEDAFGNQEPSGGLAVAFGLGSGSAGGTFGAVTDHGNGVYTATFTATTAGTNSVTCTIGGQSVTSTAPTVTVTPGPVSLSASTLTATSTSVQVGSAITVTLTARDAFGNPESGRTLAVAFALGTGNGSGTLSAVTNNGDGTYTVSFTGTAAGNVTILATINSQPVPATVSVSVTSGSGSSSPPPPEPILSGPADITSLVGIQPSSLIPVRSGRHKAPTSFVQVLSITNNSADLFQGSIVLVLANLGPFKRSHHHLVPQATLLDANGITMGFAPGSPFLFANTLGGQLAPSQAVSFMLEFHTKGSRNITYVPLVLVGFSQP